MSYHMKKNIFGLFFFFCVLLVNVTSLDFCEVSINLGDEPCNNRESLKEFNLKNYKTKFLIAIHTHGDISSAIYLNGLASKTSFDDIEAGQLTMNGTSQSRISGAQMRNYILSINKNNKDKLYNMNNKKNSNLKNAKKKNFNKLVTEKNSNKQPFINLFDDINILDILIKFENNKGIFVTDEIFFQSPSQPRTNFAARAYIEGLFNISKNSLVNLNDLQSVKPHLNVQILSAAHNNDYSSLKLIQEKIKSCIKFLFNFNLLKSIKEKSDNIERDNYNISRTNAYLYCFDKIFLEHFSINACPFVKNYLKMFKKSITAACSSCKKLSDVLKKSNEFVYLFLSQIYLAEKAANIKRPLEIIHNNIGEEEYENMLNEFIYPDENLFSNIVIAKLAASNYLNFLNAWLVAKAYHKYDELILTIYALGGCETLINELVTKNNTKIGNEKYNENIKYNKNTVDKLKFIFLSTHKSILIAILTVLNIYNWNVVPFGARLYVQLLEKTDQSSEDDTEKMFEEIIETDILDEKEKEEQAENEDEDESVNEMEETNKANLNNNPFFFIDSKKVRIKEKKKRKRNTATLLNENVNTKKNNTLNEAESKNYNNNNKNKSNNNNKSTDNNTSKKYFVRILYGSPNIDLVTIKLPFCEERTICELSTWLEEITNEIRINDDTSNFLN